MHWKYYIPHAWDEPLQYWEDIWLWPVERQIISIRAPYGQKGYSHHIPLTIESLGYVLLSEEEPESIELGTRLQQEALSYWIWPYPDAAFWTDDISMIVNHESFTRAQTVYYARIYLEHMGYEVDSLTEADESEVFDLPDEEDELDDGNA